MDNTSVSCFRSARLPLGLCQQHQEAARQTEAGRPLLPAGCRPASQPTAKSSCRLGKPYHGPAGSPSTLSSSPVATPVRCLGTAAIHPWMGWPAAVMGYPCILFAPAWQAMPTHLPTLHRAGKVGKQSGPPSFPRTNLLLQLANHHLHSLMDRPLRLPQSSPILLHCPLLTWLSHSAASFPIAPFRHGPSAQPVGPPCRRSSKKKKDFPVDDRSSSETPSLRPANH